MTVKKSQIALSLISHTNIGKTTLARTLLRKDIGLVADRAHVTLENQKYTVLETDAGESLQLWDTPGFPNCQKILSRLQGAKNPIVRILTEVWDRFRDRPSWCAQQAVLNVQQEADIVLYLVNAAEEPSMAGYIAPELQLLEWIEKPVVVLLNQTGRPRDRDEQQRLEQPWKDYFARYGFVKGVHSLDAFSRCWVQEGMLFETIQSLLPSRDRSLMNRLFTAWQNANLAVFHASMEQWTMLVSHAARSRVMTGADGSPMDVQKQQAVDSLLKDLVNEVGVTTKAVIALHGLEGDAIGVIQARMEHVEVQRGSQGRGDATLSGTAIGGIGGALTSGAYAGLHLDAATGGVSMGLFTVAGAVVGGVLGFFGGEAWADRQAVRTPTPVTWSNEYLNVLVQDVIVRYLAIAHFGRGQGEYVMDPENPRFWVEKVNTLVSKHHTTLHEEWKRLRGQEPLSKTEEKPATLAALLTSITLELLWNTYPASKRFLNRLG
ncbi:GTPase domain-containing protein [Nitrospira sp. CMX1]|nr:GTPase domain-containing protein [Nitrospira sp.]MBS0164748.1 GTPase domain-containing protein [Nitrospira sp.]